jgi:DNA-binding beta-propeller fold protein YncE
MVSRIFSPAFASPAMSYFAIRLSLILALAAVSWSAAGAAEQIDLQPQPDFFQLPAGLKLGQCSGVAVNSKGDVYLFHRGKQPILCFNSQGKFLRSWGDDVIGKAHGLRTDKDDNVWVTDIAGMAGDSEDQFNMPTDVAFGPHDELYISDGYGNSRVCKYTTSGKFVKTWGHKGTGPGEFNTPHAVRVDGEGRVYVADRENKRIQIFDADGKLQHVAPGPAPYGLMLVKDGTLYVADGIANTVLHLDARGNVLQTWGRTGSAPGEYQLPHGIDVDHAGNVYVSEIAGMRAQKLSPKAKK